MANAVFIQNAHSIYDDRIGIHYHFPKQYLRLVQETIGDWVIFYQGKLGAAGYTHAQKVISVREDPLHSDRYYADLDQASMLDFEVVVPRLGLNDLPFERRLPPSGGLNASAVRRLTANEFDSILTAAFELSNDPNSLPRQKHGFSEPLATFEHKERILTSRLKRDEAFSRMVKRAYEGRCALSGLELRNGGGRPEVEAAHIKPVKNGGPDVIRNGIALSGTLHWMFDRGLIAISDDFALLISHNKVSQADAQRLFHTDRRLRLPKDPRHHPHLEFIRYHRENVFGAVSK